MSNGYRAELADNQRTEINRLYSEIERLKDHIKKMEVIHSLCLKRERDTARELANVWKQLKEARKGH